MCNKVPSFEKIHVSSIDELAMCAYSVSADALVSRKMTFQFRRKIHIQGQSGSQISI